MIQKLDLFAKMYEEAINKGDVNIARIHEELFSRELEHILLNYNPNDIVESFIDIIKPKTFPTISVKKNEIFYRARRGHDTVSGAIDDCDGTFVMPHHAHDIEKVPPMLAPGGRFNRSGTSFLYIASDVHTAIAEVHAQVGEICSIGTFCCKKDITLINLSDKAKSPKINLWCNVILQPIYPEKLHIYKLTQFVTDVFVQSGMRGFYFNSVQTDTGKNVVCFANDVFELEKYSEKLYYIKKVSYAIEEYKDWTEKIDVKLLNSYNSEEDEERDRKIDYLATLVKNK
ncbi:MAG: RES family NAD+ phosphorylase [Synergistaceae bacterium]|nr:RES family NAD+ phosphorylase [Candidatus Equadaptatus faecalis]